MMVGTTIAGRERPRASTRARHAGAPADTIRIETAVAGTEATDATAMAAGIAMPAGTAVTTATAVTVATAMSAGAGAIRIAAVIPTAGSAAIGTTATGASTTTAMAAATNGSTAMVSAR